ncbi:MAG: DegT/DnrJ/EryC1/StrS family aminotransferase [Acidobacteria bacterium]|nr:DegT/DnrJ/EryC1/StrS family aminotransferase [Acidobacteriota bacterium]
MPRGVWRRFEEAVRRGDQWNESGRAARNLERLIERKVGLPDRRVLVTINATAALRLACSHHFAEGYQPRVCPLTWPATFAACEAGVQWVDCDEGGWPVAEVDIGVALWGRPWPARLPAPVIMDAAHRLFYPGPEGSEYAIFSFGPTKEAACPVGGALLMYTDGGQGLEDMLAYANCGAVGRTALVRDNLQPVGGIKACLPAPFAAWIAAQIGRQPQLRAARQRVLQEYADCLGNLLITKPGEASGHLAVLRFASEGERLAVETRLARNRVQTSLHYPAAVALREVCPGAWELSRRILSIPCHDQMRSGDAHRVARLVASAL